MRQGEHCESNAFLVSSYDYSGIGKGLYLVKKYVEELQGSVTVESELGKGSTFTVKIPARTNEIATINTE